jgi:hypothetical protein
MAKFKGFKQSSILALVGALTTVLVSLYAGGIMLDAVGDVINGTTSAFYTGLTLIGYTMCPTPDTTQVCSTSGSGILAVVGIIGLMKIINIFVKF